VRTQRTRVKFCGMTRVDDALAAAALGVDAVGVVLTRRSKRCVGIDVAREIRRALPPLVTFVTLFMDDEPAFVAEAVAGIGPDLLQFHGSEAAPDCVRYGRPYMKAVAMGAGGAWQATVEAHPRAAALLFDGHARGEPGGAGQRFDWSAIPHDTGRPIVMAGGLTPGNIGEAIRSVRPYAVDVSSGTESAPGVKDMDKMRRFIAAVRSADEAL
jgi:phosphoribosylanthranilate isomerase